MRLGTGGSASFELRGDTEPYSLKRGIIRWKALSHRLCVAPGASGLTFYDNDVVSLFSPDAQENNTVFLVALGKSRKQAG
jgi:hypothetical protein